MSAYGSPLAAQKDDKAESETNTKENEKKCFENEGWDIWEWELKMGVGWGKEKEVREYEKDVMRNVR